MGQFCGYPNLRPDLLVDSHPWSTFRTEYMDEIRARSGKLPAIMGVDYFGNTAGINEAPDIVTTEHSHERTLNFGDIPGTGQNLNRALIDWWRGGGLVTVSIHSYRPDTHREGNSGALMKFGRGGDPRAATDERFREYDLRRILPGGADRANWEAMMDGMADGLTQLRDAGVVVLWRPFHEMDWGFWWGRHEPELFHAVWRDLFARFTMRRELNNLIWVFTGSQAYYPGDEYVDVVGADIYQPTFPRQELLRGAAGRGKLAAVTEFGFGIDERRDNSTASYDFRQLLGALRESTPEAIYALVWSDAWRIGNPRHTGQREMMNDSWVITRDEVEVHPHRAAAR